MIIRDHCRPGAYGNREGWEPACDWPEDCVVQWGGQGVVFEGERVRRTAFFEAFPADPATFIRGEGADVPAAEAAAFAKFTRQRDCAGHELERRGYTNGAGICAHCGLFVSHAFEPLPEPEAAPGLLGRAFGGDQEALRHVLESYLAAQDGAPSEAASEDR